MKLNPLLQLSRQDSDNVARIADALEELVRYVRVLCPPATGDDAGVVVVASVDEVEPEPRRDESAGLRDPDEPLEYDDAEPEEEDRDAERQEA